LHEFQWAERFIGKTSLLRLNRRNIDTDPAEARRRDGNAIGMTNGNVWRPTPISHYNHGATGWSLSLSKDPERRGTTTGTQERSYRITGRNAACDELSTTLEARTRRDEADFFRPEMMHGEFA
jgi:hypothetical protein